jgi:hypothetical protein
LDGVARNLALQEGFTMCSARLKPWQLGLTGGIAWVSGLGALMIGAGSLVVLVNFLSGNLPRDHPLFERDPVSVHVTARSGEAITRASEVVYPSLLFVGVLLGGTIPAFLAVKVVGMRKRMSYWIAWLGFGACLLAWLAMWCFVARSALGM